MTLIKDTFWGDWWALRQDINRTNLVQPQANFESTAVALGNCWTPEAAQAFWASVQELKAHGVSAIDTLNNWEELYLAREEKEGVVVDI